jgi:hypothetical protein
MLTNTPPADPIAPPFAGHRDAWSENGLISVRRRQSSRDGTLKPVLSSWLRRSLGPDILAACGQLCGSEARGNPPCETIRPFPTEAP